MKKYIDFDGVFIDSETHLFDGFQYAYKNGWVRNHREYLENMDWYRYLHKCNIIKDSLEYLKSDKDSQLLGKVLSQQEEDAKTKILKEVGYDGTPIFIHADLPKSSAVDPRGNLLTDDTVHNLDDWDKKEGYCLYFHKDGIQKDPWGNINTKYKTTKTLKLLYNIDESFFRQD